MAILTSADSYSIVLNWIVAALQQAIDEPMAKACAVAFRPRGSCFLGFRKIQLPCCIWLDGLMEFSTNTSTNVTRLELQRSNMLEYRVGPRSVRDALAEDVDVPIYAGKGTRTPQVPILKALVAVPLALTPRFGCSSNINGSYILPKSCGRSISGSHTPLLPASDLQCKKVVVLKSSLKSLKSQTCFHLSCSSS